MRNCLPLSLVAEASYSVADLYLLTTSAGLGLPRDTYLVGGGLGALRRGLVLELWRRCQQLSMAGSEGGRNSLSERSLRPESVILAVVVDLVAWLVWFGLVWKLV